MALLFPRRILIALIVPVMSGIVRFSPCSHPPLHCTALHNSDSLLTTYVYLPGKQWLESSFFCAGLFLFCIFFICSPFRSIESAHTSDEIYPISWVSRLSSAGIHVPIISTMRIMALRKWVASNQCKALQTRSNERPPFPHP